MTTKKKHDDETDDDKTRLLGPHVADIDFSHDGNPGEFHLVVWTGRMGFVWEVFSGKGLSLSRGLRTRQEDAESAALLCAWAEHLRTCRTRGAHQDGPPAPTWRRL